MTDKQASLHVLLRLTCVSKEITGRRSTCNSHTADRDEKVDSSNTTYNVVTLISIAKQKHNREQPEQMGSNFLRPGCELSSSISARCPVLICNCIRQHDKHHSTKQSTLISSSMAIKQL